MKKKIKWIIIIAILVSVAAFCIATFISAAQAKKKLVDNTFYSNTCVFGFFKDEGKLYVNLTTDGYSYECLEVKQVAPYKFRTVTSKYTPYQFEFELKYYKDEDVWTIWLTKTKDIDICPIYERHGG